MHSLDPRVNRLPKIGQHGNALPDGELDQFETFEVFVQPRHGKPFQHEGIVHAPNIEMAFVLAKEAFTRRFLCNSLCVTETRKVFVSPLTDGGQNAYDLINEKAEDSLDEESYEIYHLLKRGKQHVHVGAVQARGPQQALLEAKRLFGDKVVLNVWVVRTADIRFTTPEETDLWATLPEKKFRDASAYKGGDKLKAFLERTKS